MCPNCGAALPTSAGGGAGAVGGCLLGGVVAWMLVIAVAVVFPHLPPVLFAVSIALVTVIVVPLALPYGRKLSTFMRWFSVSTMLVYLATLALTMGMLSLCGGLH